MGFLIFVTALIIAIYFKTGFFSYLVLAFLMFISTMHSNYALAQNLTQRKVRKIDYWYVGAAASVCCFSRQAIQINGYWFSRDYSSRCTGREKSPSEKKSSRL